jgi:hypothetical protein
VGKNFEMLKETPNPIIEVDIWSLAVGLRCRIPHRHISDFKILLTST